MTTRPLDDDEREFLLSLVDDPHSDYNDELEGYTNYGIRDGVLTVTVQLEGLSYDGRWRLTFLEGEAEES